MSLLGRDDERVRRAEPRATRCRPCSPSAIAGVLEHLPAASLLLNPTVNSYKRLVPGWFAPINASWGYENRSCAVRAIRSARPELWRFECRRPGRRRQPVSRARGASPPRRPTASAARPRRRRAVEGDAYARADLPELPGSLEAALAAFEDDAVLRRASGERFSDYYATSRAWELQGLARDGHRLGARALRAGGVDVLDGRIGVASTKGCSPAAACPAASRGSPRGTKPKGLPKVSALRRATAARGGFEKSKRCSKLCLCDPRGERVQAPVVGDEPQRRGELAELVVDHAFFAYGLDREQRHPEAEADRRRAAAASRGRRTRPTRPR